MHEDGQARRLSGLLLLQPVYDGAPLFADAPGGGGKTPVMPQYIISQTPGKIILRNYEGVITTYTEPEGQPPLQCSYENCKVVEGYHYEGVAGLAQGERMSMEPMGLLRHERNKK